MKINVISGYFASIGLGLSSHKGYVDYFTSSLCCDELIVLVQSDELQYEKYGNYAIQVNEIIKEILKWIWNIKNHPKITILVNKEKNVSNSLKEIRMRFPNDDIFFCKDGDRNYDTLPQEEKKSMKENNIKFCFFNNEKKDSSTQILMKNV